MPRVVLFEPEIPPNTGNVARTCAATLTPLHLIHPLGFQLDERRLRRAGLDYWPWVDLQEHPHWQDFLDHRRERGGRLVAFTRHGERSLHQFPFAPGDWLLFGRESSGLPGAIQAAADACVRIPMPGSVERGGGVRSLNLASAVAIAVYEAHRQAMSLE